MTVISRDEVAHLARLSRLVMTEEELNQFAGQLDVIVQSMARVSEVSGAGIPPDQQFAPLVNVLRDDVQLPCLTQEEALANGPDVYEGRFRVPRILDEEA